MPQGKLEWLLVCLVVVAFIIVLWFANRELGKKGSKYEGSATFATFAVILFGLILTTVYLVIFLHYARLSAAWGSSIASMFFGMLLLCMLFESSPKYCDKAPERGKPYYGWLYSHGSAKTILGKKVSVPWWHWFGDKYYVSGYKIFEETFSQRMRSDHMPNRVATIWLRIVVHIASEEIAPAEFDEISASFWQKCKETAFKVIGKDEVDVEMAFSALVLGADSRVKAEIRRIVISSQTEVTVDLK